MTSRHLNGLTRENSCAKKVRFTSRVKAQDRINQLHHKRLVAQDEILTVYYCHFCGHYHYGNTFSFRDSK